MRNYLGAHSACAGGPGRCGRERRGRPPEGEDLASSAAAGGGGLRHSAGEGKGMDSGPSCGAEEEEREGDDGGRRH